MLSLSQRADVVVRAANGDVTVTRSYFATIISLFCISVFHICRSVVRRSALVNGGRTLSSPNAVVIVVDDAALPPTAKVRKYKQFIIILFFKNFVFVDFVFTFNLEKPNNSQPNKNKYQHRQLSGSLGGRAIAAGYRGAKRCDGLGDAQLAASPTLVLAKLTALIEVSALL